MFGKSVIEKPQDTLDFASKGHREKRKVGLTLTSQIRLVNFGGRKTRKVDESSRKTGRLLNKNICQCLVTVRQVLFAENWTLHEFQRTSSKHSG